MNPSQFLFFTLCRYLWKFWGAILHLILFRIFFLKEIVLRKIIFLEWYSYKSCWVPQCRTRNENPGTSAQMLFVWIDINLFEHLDLTSNWLLHFTLLKESVYITYTFLSAGQCEYNTCSLCVILLLHNELRAYPALHWSD